MKTNELNVNEMAQVSGGNFFADLEEVLRRIFAEPKKQNNTDQASPKYERVRIKC